MTANFVSRRLIRWAAVGLFMVASPIALLSEWPVYAQSSPTAIIEIQGAITALTDTTLVVNGLTVDISTAQKRGTLVVGAIVKVEGTLLADGTVKARQVKVVTDATAPQENELTGSVESITGAVMVVSGQSFNTASAEIGSGVVVGVRVKVHFTIVDGVFVAREVSLAAAPRRDDTPRGDRVGENELTGTVESIAGAVMVVSGQSFNTASAEIGSGVIVGAQVKVHYAVVDGVNVAREIHLATDPDRSRDDNPRRGGDDGAGHDAGDDHGGRGRGGDDSGRGGRDD
jgi:hypothetical protein